MNRFNFWIADDLLHRPVSQALENALGKENSYADFQVFSSPSDVVEACERITKKDQFPDIALIDVSFASASATGPIAKVPADVQGFVVAAELKHYAKQLDKEDWTYRIYTANEEIQTDFRCLYFNPYGHESLLPISIKGKAVQAFDFVAWLRSASHVLVRQRLLHAEEDLSVLSDLIDEVKLSIQGLWSDKWRKCCDEFEQCIRPEIDRFIRRIEDELRDNEDLAKNHYVPVEQLKDARTCGAVQYALRQASGNKVFDLASVLTEKCDNFVDEYASLISEALRKVTKLADQFVRVEKFKTCIAPLFPFEAHEIETSPDPETITRALQNMLDLVGATVDHNYTLARAFKSLKVPGENKSIPTTVFAAACHGWQEGDWTHKFPIPRNNDEKELLLEQELGITSATNESGLTSCLGLPKETLDRICEDAKRSAGNFGYKLLAFARSEKDEWIKSPVNCLRQKFAGLHVVVEPESLESKKVLSDWGQFFGRDTDHSSGLIDRIMLEGNMRGISGAETTYDLQYKRVVLTLDFDVERHFGLLDLQKPGGNLTRLLRSFLGWGRVVIHTNDEVACYKTRWPGGKPETYPSESARPLFKIEWSIPDYLETRSAKFEARSAQ